MAEVAALVLALQILVMLWVPVNRTLIYWIYLEASYLDELQPRALIGTIWDVSGLGRIEFLAATQAALFGWLFFVALFILKPRDGSGPERPNSKSAALLAIFAFSTLPYVTNAASGFVDIFAALFVVAAAYLLSSDRFYGPMTLASGLVLMSIAMLIHEKSIFECFILIGWVTVWRGLRDGATLGAGFVVFLGGFAVLTSGASSGSEGMTSADYIGGLANSARFLVEESLNAIAILIGGGAHWILFAVLFARVFAGRFGWRAWAVLIGSVLLCLGPLLLAHDTNRLVSIIWLPCLLLSRSVPLTSLSSGLVAGLLVLQLLMPPIFVYQQTTVALNCYGAAFARTVGAMTQDQPDWLNMRLRTDRDDISGLFSCAPVHLTRPSKDR